MIQTVPNSEELAKVIGCDHNTLLKTLEKYNALARGEAKDEFGRTNAPFQIKPQSELRKPVFFDHFFHRFTLEIL